MTISTVGLGDYTMSDAHITLVILQFVLFLPGLALFAEFINLGNAASAAADEHVGRMSDNLTRKMKRGTSVHKEITRVPKAGGAGGRSTTSAQVGVGDEGGGKAEASASSPRAAVWPTSERAPPRYAAGQEQ